MSNDDGMVRIRPKSDKKLSHLAVNYGTTKKSLNSDILENCKTEDGKILCEVELEEVK